MRFGFRYPSVTPCSALILMMLRLQFFFIFSQIINIEKYLQKKRMNDHETCQCTFTTPTMCSVFLPFLDATNSSNCATEALTTTYLRHITDISLSVYHDWPKRLPVTKYLIFNDGMAGRKYSKCYSGLVSVWNAINPGL